MTTATVPADHESWVAREWTCHAATTIGHVAGDRFVPVAEFTGFGSYADACAVTAADVVRKLNAHDDLLAALETCRRSFASDPFPLTASALEADRQAALAITKAGRAT